MGPRYRSNHAVVEFKEHLGERPGAIEVPWATFEGDLSSQARFTVPTDDVRDAYLELQVYDVDSFEHDVLVNGEPLTGFDLPPNRGWQCWLNAFEPDRLRAGENTIRIRRASETLDEFVVGAVTVNWREPIAAD